MRSHHFVRLAARCATVIVEWVTQANGDLDLFLLDAGGSSVCTETVSPNIPEEDPACELPTAGTYYIWMNNWDADAHGNAAGTNYHVVVETN